MNNFLRITMVAATLAVTAGVQARVATESTSIGPFDDPHVYSETVVAPSATVLLNTDDYFTRMSVFNGRREICHQVYVCPVATLWGFPKLLIVVSNYGLSYSSYRITYFE